MPRKKSAQKPSNNSTTTNNADDSIPYFERGENDETEIDRWLRMVEEEAKEKENHNNNVRRLINNDGVNVSGRLTAPQNEVRKRQK